MTAYEPCTLVTLRDLFPSGFILLQADKKLSLFMTILAKKIMTGAIFLCRGLMFNNDVTH